MPGYLAQALLWVQPEALPLNVFSKSPLASTCVRASALYREGFSLSLGTQVHKPCTAFQQRPLLPLHRTKPALLNKDLQF